MKKNILLAVVVVFLMLFVFVLLGERRQEVDKEIDKEVDKEQIERQMVRETKENQKRYFMEGCTKDGNYKYCECFYDKLKDKYGTDAINDMTAEVLSGDFSDESWDKMISSAKECINYYK